MALPPAELGVARHAEALSIAELRLDVLSAIPLVALFGCSAGWSRLVKGINDSASAATGARPARDRGWPDSAFR